MARAMGATAISSVMDSSWIQCSSSSRSNRRCRRTIAPADAAASRFNSPKMWEGGVATWKRSPWPRPRARHQCDVASAMERWVWRTALGRSVVPELNTRTDSQSSSTRATRGARRRSPGQSPRRRLRRRGRTHGRRRGDRTRGVTPGPSAMRTQARSDRARWPPRLPSRPGSGAPAPRRACWRR